MTVPSVESRIKKLCAVFNSGVSVGYRRDNDDWHVSFRDVYLCVETGSTMRHQDGSVEKLLAAGGGPGAFGKTLAEAVEKIEKQTVANGRGFVLSNQAFGLFCGGYDDDGLHIITAYEGEKPVDSFPYDKEKVRALIHKYRP